MEHTEWSDVEISNNKNNRFQFVWQCNQQQQQVYQIIHKSHYTWYYYIRPGFREKTMHCVHSAEIEFSWRFMSISLLRRARHSISEYFLECSPFILISIRCSRTSNANVKPIWANVLCHFCHTLKFNRLIYEFIFHTFTHKFNYIKEPDWISRKVIKCSLPHIAPCIPKVERSEGVRRLKIVLL